jgi:hypothetical protein
MPRGQRLKRIKSVSIRSGEERRGENMKNNNTPPNCFVPHKKTKMEWNEKEELWICPICGEATPIPLSDERFTVPTPKS